MRRHYDDELYHFGIKGMKWGVRRFQDASGRLTAAGRSRYGQLANSRVGRAVGRVAKPKYATTKADYRKAKSDYKKQMSGIKADRKARTDKMYNLAYNNKRFKRQESGMRKYVTAVGGVVGYNLARKAGLSRGKAATAAASVAGLYNASARLGSAAGKRVGRGILSGAARAQTRGAAKSAKQNFKNTQAYKDQRSRNIRRAAAGAAALGAAAAIGGKAYSNHRALHPKNYSNMTVDVTKAFRKSNRPGRTVGAQYMIGGPVTRGQSARNAASRAGRSVKGAASRAGSSVKGAASRMSRPVRNKMNYYGVGKKRVAKGMRIAGGDTYHQSYGKGTINRTSYKAKKFAGGVARSASDRYQKARGRVSKSYRIGTSQRSGGVKRRFRRSRV